MSATVPARPAFKWTRGTVGRRAGERHAGDAAQGQRYTRARSRRGGSCRAREGLRCHLDRGGDRRGRHHKSGFFYHFRDKNELAKALLVRYVEREDALFDELFARADELNDDPLHGFLVGLRMMSELMADLPNGHPGCLVASYCYQDRLFDKEVRAITASAVLNWRKRFRQRLDLIAELYPPRVEVDLDDLADMLSVIADGGIIISKAIKDKQVLARQMLLYRDFIKVVFLGVPSS